VEWCAQTAENFYSIALNGDEIETNRRQLEILADPYPSLVFDE
jgi:hypothetical protein